MCDLPDTSRGPRRLQRATPSARDAARARSREDVHQYAWRLVGRAPQPSIHFIAEPCRGIAQFGAARNFLFASASLAALHAARWPRRVRGGNTPTVDRCLACPPPSPVWACSIPAAPSPSTAFQSIAASTHAWRLLSVACGPTVALAALLSALLGPSTHRHGCTGSSCTRGSPSIQLATPGHAQET